VRAAARPAPAQYAPPLHKVCHVLARHRRDTDSGRLIAATWDVLMTGVGPAVFDETIVIWNIVPFKAHHDADSAGKVLLDGIAEKDLKYLAELQKHWLREAPGRPAHPRAPGPPPPPHPPRMSPIPHPPTPALTRCRDLRRGLLTHVIPMRRPFPLRSLCLAAPREHLMAARAVAAARSRHGLRRLVWEGRPRMAR
jgi:hypothetical protein